ncbi:hypothetical protein DW228_06160 [Bacteroides fragilis]|uniref:Uncharacterized protein n=1 Tax=Bacteroides fragilis TaxID=817 RepID=A0A396C1D9_BACFG|nr:hypothetical protein [Bacteroides fragilis]RHH14381.1 hypothetical protein DW228_06160 [Bacteroides fragilis]
MAKIKTNPENEVTEVEEAVEQGTEVQEIEAAAVEISGKAVVPEPVRKVKQERSQPEEELEPLVKDILRAYSKYEMLYIDKNGGVYSPDTLPVVRRNAILYTNPFYKP